MNMSLTHKKYIRFEFSNRNSNYFEVKEIADKFLTALGRAPDFSHIYKISSRATSNQNYWNKHLVACT